MAVKLKSILRQIHWSLAAKAAIFGVAWFFLPFWLFLIIACCLYIIPWLQAGKLLGSFFALLVLAYVASPHILLALLLAALFYYLLLIKDLLLIDRRSAYEILILVTLFFLVEYFYYGFGAAGISGHGLWYGFLLAALIALLAYSFLTYFSEKPKRDFLRRGAVWLTFLLAWQFLIVGLFLPVDAMYQAGIIFLALTLTLDFIAQHYYEKSN